MLRRAILTVYPIFLNAFMHKDTQVSFSTLLIWQGFIVAWIGEQHEKCMKILRLRLLRS